ncbi:putative holin [uncultured Pseudacidovorax sp.]|uniref:putative holin n=1 Tax=uncultured Pseudacidovorax sp. TaxID=679313 RepID=UPI0025E69D00|nr:putative holin [uncultured Pseudacidovorax sp.]
MPEPTTTTAASLAAGASTLAMALLGVEYYALVWGLIGALCAAYHAERMPWPRALIFVGLSTLVGAACGAWANESLGKSTTQLAVLSLVCGFGAQAILIQLLRIMLERIERLLGRLGDRP